MALRASGVRRFALHYLAMVVAMLAGMMLFHPVWMLATGGVDASSVLREAEIDSLAMATGMAIGMGAWMRFRRHSWLPILEMCAAMYAGFVVLFPALWAGLLDGPEVMMFGHLLMLVFMLLAMLLRRGEYSAAAHRH